jgi:N-acetylated-alpha-linked acidic dipeptidase
VWKRTQLQRISNARTTEDRNEIRQRFDLRIGAMGSGSDYTAFLDHLGIASLNIGYGGEDGGGIYHSIYDDFYWYTTFSDKDFSYGRSLAQTGATAVLRAADADILPFDFSNFAETVRRYLEELKKLHQSQQDEIRERNKQLAEGVFAAIADPQEVSVPPPVSEEPPFINFAPLENAVNQLSRSAEKYEQAMKEHTGKLFPDSKLRALNSKLIRTERVLVHPDGLPGRPWFKHMLYAPGQYTGYGVKTIPGVREAIERKKWKEAESEIIRAAHVLEAEATLIESAVDEFESTK